MNTIQAAKKWAQDYKNLGGRPRSFETPDEMLDAFMTYLESHKESGNFWKEQPAGKDGHVQRFNCQTPLTLEAACLHMGITPRGFANYRKEEKYPGFFPIVQFIEQTIRQNQVAGAAAGVFNSVIVSRINKIEELRKVDSKIDANVKAKTNVNFNFSVIDDIDDQEE